MRASYAGLNSIEARTKMHQDDVLELISSNKVVSLGSAKGREFLLFYSPPDNCVKIAIVGEGREVLISVQDSNCKLPFILTVPIESLIRTTRQLVKDFIFEKARKDKPLTKNNKNEFRVRIKVVHNEKAVYDSEISKAYAGEKLGDHKSVALFFMKDLQKIAQILDVDICELLISTKDK